MADPTRAPGLRRHRTGYRLQPIVPEHIAEALADRWETTGEKPSDTVRRYVGEGIERDRRAAAADWQTVDTNGGPRTVGWIVVRHDPSKPRPRAWLHSEVLSGPHSSREDADTRAGRLNAHGLPVEVVRVVLDPRDPYLREVDDA